MTIYINAALCLADGIQAASYSLIGQKRILPRQLQNEAENPPNEEVIEGEFPNLQINSTLVGYTQNL